MGKITKRAKIGWMLLICMIGVWANAAPLARAAEDADIPKVIEKVSPTVVAIIGKPGEDKNGGRNRFNLAHGTGVIVKSNGYILTNAHVVKDMKNIAVVTADGKSYPGKTTHFDEESDLALVKIEANGLQEAVFASPNDVRVGETVMAIGTPISFALRNSVTSGIISGLDRSVNSKYQLLQTDAAINPGNSGGALVNMRGQVVGINTMKYVDYSVESLGFAIPVSTVQYVLNHFFTYGKVMRPYTGLELEESWEAVVGLPAKESLKVAYVDPDSPAAKAGIKQGDTIVSFDQTSVKTIVEYNELMKQYLPRQTVQVTLKTAGGETAVRKVVLEEDTHPASAWTQDSEGSYIDDDQGKTRIGDSHYGWSLKYPAGLIKSNQSEEGDRVTFTDSKGEFTISLSVEEQQSEDLSVPGLLRKLSRHADDTILEKRYVDQAANPYAKVVGKTSTGAYYQARAYLKGDKIYYITLYVEEEENYKNRIKRNAYNDLLDSFKLSFDPKDSALKDISVYKSGDSTFKNEYGLSFNLPSGWEENHRDGVLSYRNKDYTQQVIVRVSSASSGDTLNDWTDREEKQFKDSYVEQYRRMSEWKELTVAGVPARQIRYSWTMGEEWSSKEVLYFIKDKYKYKIEIILLNNDADSKPDDAWVGNFVKSVKVQKEDMNTSLGFIQDEEELIDKNKTVSYTNQKYKYTVRVPEIWSALGSGILKDAARSVFSFTGGTFKIEAEERSSLEEVVKRLELGHKKNAENDGDYRYAVTEETLYETQGKKITVQYNLKKAPYQQTEYVFSKNNITYTVTIKMNDAVRTEENAARAEKAAMSMQFGK